MSYTSDLGEAIAAMRKRTISLAWLAALTGLLALTACDSSTNAGTGTVRLHVASTGAATMLDAAAVAGIDNIKSATVTISEAYLMPGHVTVSLSNSQIDLLALDGDVTVGIGSVPALGSYEQLRLIVSDIEVILEDDTELPARVPSGPQTGIKIDFAEPVEVLSGDVVDLIVAFNVSESFVFQGPPWAPISVLFTPVIHVSTSQEAASIGGQVTVALNAPAPAGGTTVAVLVEALDGTVVVVSHTVNITVAEGSPSGTGDYLLPFLTSGATYTVQASAAAAFTVTAGASVGPIVGGSNPGPDFTVDEN